MGVKPRSVMLLALCLAALAGAPAAQSAEEPATLKIAAVQLGMDATLAENRDKIVRLSGEAARLVVFPEGALAAPPGTPREDYDAAAAAVAQAARKHNVYVATGARFVPEGQSRHHNQLYVFSPQGETLLVYDKVWHARKYDAPKMVSIDGVACSFIICADRWSRPVESLLPAMGAQILIECSNNFDNEWLPELGWYWYVPRAIRHTVFVVFANSAPENRLPGGNRGHGHTALIAPDGSILAAADRERDKIVTADLDLAQATRAGPIARSEHPLFKAWWEMGRQIHEGQDFLYEEVPALVSSNDSVKCGFSRMTCSPSLAGNVQKIQDHIKQGASAGLDLLVFPELAVTGDRREDIERADAAAIEGALGAIRRSAQEHGVTVVVGTPTFVGGKRRNSAYAIGPDGSVLTRYDQIAVSRPELFEGGLSTKAMWFQIGGVWSFLTIGDDRLLSTSPYKQVAQPETWRPYHWMRDSADAKVRFLWERLQVSTRPDPSDAGMAYFLLTGDEEADPQKLRRLIDEGLVPPPVSARVAVRLEAENFRDFGGFELHDRNDRAASHRLYAELAAGDTGTISTRYDEPYAADGRCDVEVRYFDAPDRKCELQLLVGGEPRGGKWQSPGTGGGWMSHTLPGVEIRRGDQIAVQAQGRAARLDYVQLNARHPR